MSVEHFHGLCQRHMGRAVEIRTHDGRIHREIIHRVSNNRVFLQPIGRRRNLGGWWQAVEERETEFVIAILEE